MATKLVANEFVAMIELQKIAHQMSPRGLGILSVFLVSFANFASIGIVAGAIKGLNEQGADSSAVSAPGREKMRF